MKYLCLIAISLIILPAFSPHCAQSGKVPKYSESSKNPAPAEKEEAENPEPPKASDADDGIIRINTELVMVSARVSDKKGRVLQGLRQQDFIIFEEGIPQETAYFSSDEQPVTVVLMLDMSYSSAFKLSEIQAAALTFLGKLRPDDEVMVVSFHEKPEILCRATTNRKVARLAIEGASIKTGTSLYDSIEAILGGAEKEGARRKAVVLLSDGVDTTSKAATAASNLEKLGRLGLQVFPFQYQTYGDVQKLSEPEVVEGEQLMMAPKVVAGTRLSDYDIADGYLKELAGASGGRLYRVSNVANLNKAFENLASELRKIYTLGYYPIAEHKSGRRYRINIRINRPGLTIRAREGYIAQNSKTFPGNK